MVNIEKWTELTNEFAGKKVTLVAVSKKKPVSDIEEFYKAGQYDFGENYVQELVEKQSLLPADVRWHFIGHLQSNKVKYIAPFVYLIHAVDNFSLLEEINKQALKNNRVIRVLLQMHIADEETKFGMDETEINAFVMQYLAKKNALANVCICGLMGMATNTEDMDKVRGEFRHLHTLFIQLGKTAFTGDSEFAICSIGMSADYNLAIREGGNMVRIGSLLFGQRSWQG